MEDGAFELTKQDQLTVINNHIGLKTLEGPWEVFFPKGWGAPEKAVFPELKSWTESENDGIKYFSGIARYEKTFVHDYNPVLLGKTKIYLDLGDLSNVGEVWLNDQPLGITWAKPFMYDITEILRPGENKLKIEIANTWSNRIVGDALKGEKYTSVNIRDTNIKGLYGTYMPWKEVPLLKSGLLGPVKIITIKPIN